MVGLDNLNTFIVEDGEKGFTLKIFDKTDITDAQLVDILGHDRIVRLQKLQLTKNKEQYEKLQPVGYKHATESVKKYRKELENEHNVQKMQWIHDNVSYDSDGNMNIIKLHKIFCEDVSGIQKRCTWEEAKQLVASKGYILLSDYNDYDSVEAKEQSDWYKVLNIFSNGKGDTVEAMELFRNISGCNGVYWTATENVKKNSKGVVCRELFLRYCLRSRDRTDEHNHVCGFKDFM